MDPQVRVGSFCTEVFVAQLSQEREGTGVCPSEHTAIDAGKFLD